MALDFHHILRRVGARSLHKDGQNLVHQAAVLIINMAIDHGIGLILRQFLAGGRLKERLTYGQGLFAANTHNAYGTLS